MGGLGHQHVLQICCRSSLPFQGGCSRSQLRSRLPDGDRMSSGSVAYSRWVQAPCRHSLNLQRGQHAGAGLGTEPHDPSGGQHDAVRCWLGPGSNDLLRCGSSSVHTTFAMRNLLLLAKNPSGDARCCLASAKLGKHTFYPAYNAPPPLLWLSATVGWVGALFFFAIFFSPFFVAVVFFTMKVAKLVTHSGRL